MGLFDEWKKRNNRKSENIGFEYYEDTHNEQGDYVGPGFVPPLTQDLSDEKNEIFNDIQDNSKNEGGKAKNSLPNVSDGIAPRNYQNVVVYKPSTPEDVQTLIDFLKRREPAIVNLDDMDSATSQRVLDFVSGAIYALSGSVHRIAGNIFLISPEGIEITVPYEKKTQEPDYD